MALFNNPPAGNSKAPMPVPTPPQRAPQPEVPRHQLHPEALKAAADWSELCLLRDRLVKENQGLRNELEIERRHCSELQHQLDRVTEMRDYFQRYSVEVKTHLAHIASAATAAQDRALEVAHDIEPQKQVEPPPVAQIEDDIAEMARRFAPKQPE